MDVWNRTRSKGRRFGSGKRSGNNFVRCATRDRLWRWLIGIWMALATAGGAWAQKTLTWEETKQKFETSNPTLLAARIGVQESRADEITAYLRPNPQLTLSLDQMTPFTSNPYRPFTFFEPTVEVDYLIERRHKRSLRLESAKEATAVAVSQLDDQERNLLFNLRGAFVQVLQQKAVVAIARENLQYYDRVLQVSRDQLKVGDIASVDLDRLELQRVQFESDLQTAIINLRTAKIQLLMLLNDHTPADRFDVIGPFEFSEILMPLEEFRQIALQTRPDLAAAVQSVEMARTNYRLAVANGSTDPIVGVDAGRDPPISALIGFNVSIPLRIFDRNQGEKARTKLDIARNQQLVDGARAQVFNDVDSAHAALEGNLILLRPYKARYLQQAGRVRDAISYAYQHGGASLLDFLQAQQDYRGIQLSYLNLVGAYLAAASQMNLAVGQEVIK
jgi:outer membrane protein, heavy metal efflux system